MLLGEKKIDRPYRIGAVGGGGVSPKHRRGAMYDNIFFKLTAGTFDINPERSLAIGLSLGIDKDRIYPDYQTMIAEEAKREDGIEVLDICTPNFLHYENVKAGLNAGLHVICEKPLFFEVEQGEEILKLAAEKNRFVGVCYGFSGHPLIMQMRKMVEGGDIGTVNMVELEYAHGFGCDALSDVKVEAQKWRVDPKKSGPSFVLGDLSTHTFYMSELICPQLKLKQVLCDRQSFVKSRAPLEDNAYVLMRYEGGAVGRMWASAVNAGCMDGNRIRIVGSKASIEWSDHQPNELIYQVQGEPMKKMIRAMPYLYDEANAFERLGALHAEGLIESWANIYAQFALAIDATNRGDKAALDKLVLPDLAHGVDGIRWVTKCVESANKGGVWVDF